MILIIDWSESGFGSDSGSELYFVFNTLTLLLHTTTLTEIL